MTPAPPRSAINRLLAISAVVVMAAACGSGASSNRAATASAHAAFLTTVDTVCARAVSAHAGHQFPLSNFDPNQPNPDQLPIVGNYFARYGGLPQTLTALHTLAPPASDAAAWRQLLTVADQMRDNAQRQITAARAKDVTIFVTTVHTAQRLTDELDTNGARFGFTSNSSCGHVFG
jgi:hypothetical protein